MPPPWRPPVCFSRPSLKCFFLFPSVPLARAEGRSRAVHLCLPGAAGQGPGWDGRVADAAAADAVNSLLPWLGCSLTALHFLREIQERGSTEELFAWSVREMHQISAAGECLTMKAAPARSPCQVAWLCPCCPHHPMPSVWADCWQLKPLLQARPYQATALSQPDPISISPATTKSQEVANAQAMGAQNRSNQLLGELHPPHCIPMQKGEHVYFKRSREEQQQPPAQRLLPSVTCGTLCLEVTSGHSDALRQFCVVTL